MEFKFVIGKAVKLENTGDAVIHVLTCEIRGHEFATQRCTLSEWNGQSPRLNLPNKRGGRILASHQEGFIMLLIYTR